MYIETHLKVCQKFGPAHCSLNSLPGVNCKTKKKLQFLLSDVLLKNASFKEKNNNKFLSHLEIPPS